MQEKGLKFKVQSLRFQVEGLRLLVIITVLLFVFTQGLYSGNKGAGYRVWSERSGDSPAIARGSVGSDTGFQSPNVILSEGVAGVEGSMDSRAGSGMTEQVKQSKGLEEDGEDGDGRPDSRLF